MSRTLPLVQEVVTEVVTESATMEIALPALAIAAAVFGAGFFATGPVLPTGLRVSGLAAALAVFCVHIHVGGWLTGADRPIASFLDGHHTALLDELTRLSGAPASAVAVTTGTAVWALALRHRRRDAAAGMVLAAVGAAALGGAALADDGGSVLPGAVFAALTALFGLFTAIASVIRSRPRRVGAVGAGVLAVVAAPVGRLYSGDDRLTVVIVAMLLAALVVTCAAGPVRRAAAETRSRHTASSFRRGRAAWRYWAAVPWCRGARPYGSNPGRRAYR
ncbi:MULTISPECIES: hypothetical protein [unclassified Rhodococcus (in: high G+C Gram-positive bacteria)]|uniref:hypothetical protein n=1 Tax=unclassified Rhodococcus (in: high G+C Gram-positive bacteria) TaxID=192944 RepID=UPI00163A3B44|nr:MULTISPECIES: hypothetical protein [unclassified Rhodococcus (in: high G+C Gram-positive bacteria)]MBC2638131.1 hypothetical protein [Rhodococcus sp. 3A]MBC2897125.1 hypothetical protein [Rhodococcus sp. 4CII]